MKPGDLVDDRFELLDLAGSGGMGAVYRARDRYSSEQVAVKVMRPIASELTDRFAREIRVLAQLRHPGIVRHVADGVTNGEMWLAMEWLEGEPLGSRIRRTGISATQAVQVVRRVAEALGAAHERGVVHRDVKPSNLFVVKEDLARVKLLDFGVARISDGDRFSTRTGVMIGTPGYMAPEQARGDREVGPRADVFALGCVLFELLTGQHAFVGDNVMAVLAKILLEDAPRVAELRPELPHVLDELLAQILSKNPADRPADGGQLAAAFGALGELDALDTAGALSPRKSLTTSERRLLSVILIRGEERDLDTFAEAQANEPTLAVTNETPQTVPGQPVQAEMLSRLAGAANAHGAMLDRLIDGSYVVTLTGSGTASDMAMQAARCALALHEVAPDAPIALATGRGVLAGKWPVGEAIDRAARFLGTAQGVRIDDVTAGLLDTRFEIGGDAAGLVLVSEREVTGNVRTVLGKATPCVGRDRELGVLMGLWDECVAEPMARAVLVVGAAGIGKSRVRVEMLDKIQAQPCEVWIGRGNPLKVGSPYGMIAPALRRAAGIRDGEAVPVRRQKLRARYLRNAAVAQEPVFLAELIGAPYDEDDHPQLRAARQDPLLMAELIRQAFVQFVAVEAATQPLVIVFEDLHWGDLASVKLIDAVLRELSDRPVFVLALARPEIHDAFPRLWHDRGAQVIRLDELTKKGSEKLVRGVLGDTASEAVVARLVEQAAGNAFYLEELIRADGGRQGRRAAGDRARGRDLAARTPGARCAARVASGGGVRWAVLAERRDGVARRRCAAHGHAGLARRAGRSRADRAGVGESVPGGARISIPARDRARGGVRDADRCRSQARASARR
ncbi:MAG: protein kinase [Kofleriaceae bacterium]